MIIDSHIHLDALDAAATTWVHARGRAGAYRALLPGVDPAQWRAALLAWGDVPYVDVCAGLHPWAWADGAAVDPGWRDDLEQDVASGRVRAVGEIGLDAVRLISDAARVHAEEAFQWQLTLAKQHALPVVIHSVRSHARVVAILRTIGWSAASDRGIVHAFSGSLEELHAYRRLGLQVGIGPRLLGRGGERLAAAVAAVDVGGWVLETDAPYGGIAGAAAPPSAIVAVGEAIAALRGCSVEEIWAENACTYAGVVGGRSGSSNR